MLQVTKIFYFEMAHAIHGYAGQCRHIHGHSYELQVTVSEQAATEGYLPETGFVIDFKVLKQIVNEKVVKPLDHKLVLSEAFVAAHPGTQTLENLLVWQAEPSAENILIHIQHQLSAALPTAVKLTELKLYETRDSFARWVAG
jgi:6-pyruvoyltetrahydropterin/6-carboxytetrahydropterin synthase